LNCGARNWPPPVPHRQANWRSSQPCTTTAARPSSARHRGAIWAQEALVYNELAQEWTKLEDIAASMGATGSPAKLTQGAFAFSEGRE
jgi:hypothetical protein